MASKFQKADSTKRLVGISVNLGGGVSWGSELLSSISYYVESYFRLFYPLNPPSLKRRIKKVILHKEVQNR